MANSNKYTLFRLKSLILGFLPSLCSCIIPIRRSNDIIISSQFCSTFEHNSKYLFQYLVNSDSHYNVYYVVNDNSLRRSLNELYGHYFITNYRLKDVLKIAFAKTWITSSFETPLMGLFLSYKRCVIHLSHGAPIKAIGLSSPKVSLHKKIYYKLISYSFTDYLSTASLFDKIWSRSTGSDLNKTFRAPMPRNDQTVKSEFRLLSDFSFGNDDTKKSSLCTNMAS